MKVDKLCAKTESELRKQLLILLKERYSLQMQKRVKEIVKSHLYKRVRRGIARLKTFLREKELLHKHEK
ncbi:50S ribosomal protein L29 [Coxiella endosymbiont of Amblyomma americanum]|uniref:50S ribosomal protein L29 n=1 Tax=Coxiella endosymbiont of Amblyomma americanum TaxID=325775 RepID=UPI00057EE583|nr:50S ribosomal protein L29 [Coxiella endosymbiont of Amblyomma americanum]AJC50431.1 LSU ribosomal protein L29P [Coxiella endosymbiont of Amblyomma americanum]AUJ58771.1 50S ribosomal protein L29 [Coxiella-like endosymbiont of Amblyomma americanum]